jgi:hypothetical protein
MTGGFAAIAWPAKHGNSGVMTFVVSHRGIVYQKDLGEDTEKLAKAIVAFDPDSSWTPTRTDADQDGLAANCSIASATEVEWSILPTRPSSPSRRNTSRTEARASTT